MSDPPRRLVLASGSPRRRDLLAGLGADVEVRPAALDETPLPGETPRAHVLRLAEAKAVAVAGPGELVLGADTVVVADGEVLGKPADDADAAAMLRRLSGRAHEVLTGVAVVDRDRDLRVSAVESTTVRFAALGDDDVAWYVATGEPRDKAGAYGIQGRGALFVDAVEGSYTNVVGLPLPLVHRLLRRAGYDLRGGGVDRRAVNRRI